MPLRFAGNTTSVQWVPPANGQKYPAYSPTSLSPIKIPELPFPDPNDRTEIPLVTVSEGTTPAGSQWARYSVSLVYWPDVMIVAGIRFHSVRHKTEAL